MLLKSAGVIGLLHLVAGLTIRGPDDGTPVPAITMTVTTTLTITVTATSCQPLPSVAPPTVNPPAINPNAPGASDPAGPPTPVASTPATTSESTPVATLTTTSDVVLAQNTPPPTPSTSTTTTPVTTTASPSTSVTDPPSSTILPLIYIYPDTGISIANIRPFFPSNNSFGTTTSFAKSANETGPSFITTLGTANAPSGAINVWPFVWTVSYAAGSGGTATTRICTVNMRDRNVQSKVDVRLQFTLEDVIISPQGEIMVDCSAPVTTSTSSATATTTSSPAALTTTTSSATPATTKTAPSNSAVSASNNPVYPLIYIYPEPGIVIRGIRPFYPSTNTFGRATSFSKPADGSGPDYITTLGMALGPDGVVNSGPLIWAITYLRHDISGGVTVYFRLSMRADGQMQKGDVKMCLTNDGINKWSPNDQFDFDIGSTPSFP